MSVSRVRPLLKYQFQEQEQIIVQHPDQVAQVMSVEAYNHFFGVSLSHGVFYDSRYAKEILALLNKCSSLAYKYKEQNLALQSFLDNPKNYFSICYINKICGYALVATEDLPADVVVGTYSGLLEIEPAELKETLPLEERAYDMGLGDFNYLNLDGIDYKLTLRAKKYSDLTRFAIHLPSRKELADLEREGLLGSISSKSVLTENITFPLADCQGVPVRYYQTIKPIKKGDIVGISYGVGYWQNRGRPCLLVRESDSASFRIAYFNKDDNKYFLSNELISTQKKEEVHNYNLSQPFSSIRKQSFFALPREGRAHPVTDSQLYYKHKPASYETTLPLTQVSKLNFLKEAKKRVVPHSQLPTQSSRYKAQKANNMPESSQGGNVSCACFTGRHK